MIDNDFETIVIQGSHDSLSEDTKNCSHSVVRPKNWVSATPKPPVDIDFGYTLDPFQKAATEVIDLNENVLVAAHTSAGKTTVAEYALASALRDGAKIVYTSPIKALSNQKYRDLLEVHGDKTGLLTGDVSSNVNAPILVMTTEILRSMLFRGSMILREVKWIVFDEVHYMRDRERGVVWEECIILLPNTIKMVFLSATVPNALEFASWVASLKKQPCHVISTNFRPTPLRHYLFTPNSNSLMLIQNERKEFFKQNLNKAVQLLDQYNESISNDDNNEQVFERKKQKFNNKNEQSQLSKLLDLIIQSNYLPTILFSFSKKEVESNAQEAANLDLTTPEEKQAIQLVYDNALNTLSDDDKKIPSLSSQLELLKKGVGVHHGGLLPIIKEITEIMFEENLIKLLFATETFAIGINMPARSVVFTGLSKFDGDTLRSISPGEYIQMSGRAGRRGLDSQGISIIQLSGSHKAEQLEQILTGPPLRLDSAFHLRYSTILNLLRVQGITPMFIIQRCFMTYQSKQKAFLLEEKIKNLEQTLDSQRIGKLFNEVILNKHTDVKCLLNGDVDLNVICRENDYIHPDLDTLLPLELRSTDSYSSADLLDFEITDFHNNFAKLIDVTRNLAKTLQYDQSLLASMCCVGRVVRITVLNEQDLSVKPKDFGYCIVHKITTEKVNGQNELFVRAYCFIDDSIDAEDVLNQLPLPSLSCFERLVQSEQEIRQLDNSIFGAFLDDNDCELTKDNFVKCSEKIFKSFRLVKFSIQDVTQVTMFVLKNNQQLVSADARLLNAAISLCRLVVCNKFKLKSITLPNKYDQPITDKKPDASDNNNQANSADAISADTNTKTYLQLHDELLAQYEEIYSLIKSSSVRQFMFFKDLYLLYLNKYRMINEINESRIMLKSETTDKLKVQLKSMTKVLRALSYIDSLNVPTNKGINCCDVSSICPVVLGEILYNYSALMTMPTSYLAAMLSMFICDDNVKGNPKLYNDGITTLFNDIYNIVKHVYNTSKECGLDIDVDSELAKLARPIMECTVEWIEDASFSDLVKKYKLYEGSLVRSFRRLEELMKDACFVTRLMGSRRLEENLLESVQKLRRGIIFTSSLYLIN